ncbi:MAG TPA: hypothetical protein VNI36_01320 [Candidatus Dormibacteraeota bacterium]|nr:hypothetical protein [Candidatus Dormibacteraeota bacterium]
MEKTSPHSLAVQSEKDRIAHEKNKKTAIRAKLPGNFFWEGLSSRRMGLCTVKLKWAATLIFSLDAPALALHGTQNPTAT